MTEYEADHQLEEQNDYKLQRNLFSMAQYQKDMLPLFMSLTQAYIKQETNCRDIILTLQAYMLKNPVTTS